MLDGPDYITNAAEAGLFTVFATSAPAAGARGITAFLVEAGTPGLTVGAVSSRWRGPRCFAWRSGLPRMPRVGRQSDRRRRAGVRLRDALPGHRTRSTGRLLASASPSACWLGARRASERRQFGRPLREYQAIEFAIADMAARSTRLGWSRTRRPGATTRSRRIGSFLARSPSSSEPTWSIGSADQTLQIFGGAGYSKDYPIERIWREVRVVRILDGTSEMMRRIVARYVFRDADALIPTGRDGARA